MVASHTEQPILVLVLSKFLISKHQDSGSSNIQIQEVSHGLCKYNRSYIKTKDARGHTISIFISAKMEPSPALGT